MVVPTRQSNTLQRRRLMSRVLEVYQQATRTPTIQRTTHRPGVRMGTSSCPVNNPTPPESTSSGARYQAVTTFFVIRLSLFHKRKGMGAVTSSCSRGRRSTVVLSCSPEIWTKNPLIFAFHTQTLSIRLRLRTWQEPCEPKVRQFSPCLHEASWSCNLHVPEEQDV